MGFYVHFSVVYSSELYKQEELKKLVDKHKQRLEDIGEKESLWILEEILNPSNYHEGPKGRLFMYGTVGNYTSMERVVEDLSPFFEEQLQNQLGPCDFDHIILFEEKEQSQQACCWELFLENGKLKTKYHDLPFCWNQW